MTTLTSVLLVAGGVVLIFASGQLSEWSIHWNRRLIDLRLFGGVEGARFFTRAGILIIGLAWVGVGLAALLT